MSSDSQNKNLLPCTTIDIPNSQLKFNVCIESTGVRLSTDGKEVVIPVEDFLNTRALRLILHEGFGINVNDQLNGYTAFYLQQNTSINKLLKGDADIPEPTICIQFSALYSDCEKEITVVDRGELKMITYIFNAPTNRSPSKIETIISGKILRIRSIKLKGTKVEERILKVVTQDREGVVRTIIGSIDEVLKKLREINSLRKSKEEYVSLFLNENAVISEEMYYSAGPWIVDGKVEIAEKTGYLPPWKDNVFYKLSDTGDPGKGIKLLADIINSYKNPAKAMTVISYGVIAWAKYFFTENFQYFPHLVIYGPNETGKSLLIDTLRVLYNFTEEERSPKSDFQLRKLLAKTTIPGMLTEGNFLVSFTQSNDKLLATLTASATTNIIAESGSSEYGGLFLAIRSLIIPTNLDIESLPSYVRDKMIILYLSKDDGYNDNKSIKTPRRMTKDDKNDVNAVMKEIYNIFANKINEIQNGLNTANREEAMQFYIKLGYNILKEIADKYGISLPEPYIPSHNDTEEDFNEIVRGGFLQFVEEKKQTLIKNGENVDFIDPINPRDALDRYGFFIDSNHELLIFGKPLLTEYGMELMKKYGLPKLTWKNIAEILGIKRTRITRYGVTLNDVFEYSISSIKEFCKALDGNPIEPNSREMEMCNKYGYYDAENGIFRLYEENDSSLEN